MKNNFVANITFKENGKGGGLVLLPKTTVYFEARLEKRVLISTFFKGEAEEYAGNKSIVMPEIKIHLCFDLQNWFKPISQGKILA